MKQEIQSVIKTYHIFFLNNLLYFIKKIIDQCGLNLDIYKIVNHLSLEGKRKLSLAIAMVGDPKILVLDEPTAGLDPI